jgi:hypothetical protein
MSRANGKGNVVETDIDRQDFVKTLAQACAKTGFEVHAYWTECDLEQCAKSAPGKLALAARLRRETSLTPPWISGRLHMGTWRSH